VTSSLVCLWFSLWALSQWVYYDWYQLSKIEHPGAVGASITRMLVTMAPYWWVPVMLFTVGGIAMVFAGRESEVHSVIFWRAAIVFTIVVSAFVIIGMKVSWSPWMNLNGLQY
jgi:hypothetical protein